MFHINFVSFTGGLLVALTTKHLGNVVDANKQTKHKENKKNKGNYTQNFDNSIHIVYEG